MTERQERLLAWAVPMAAVALAAGILLGRRADQAVYGNLALVCGIAAALLTRDWKRLGCAMLSVCALGCVLGYRAYHPALPEEGVYTVSGVVAGEIRYGDYGQIKTELHHVTLNGQKADNAYWSFYLAEEEALPEQLVPGTQVTMTAEVYHPGGADNPDGYDFREYLLQRNMTFGVYGRGNIRYDQAPFTLDGLAASLRHRMSQGLMAAMGEEAGGYASAMLLGVTALVPSEDRAAFSRLGIAHVLSISGFHVGVLAMLVGRGIHLLRWSRRTRMACVSVILGAYCLLAGAHAPVVRAALLYLLREYGAIRKRQRSGLHLLCASFILMLLAEPCQLTGASFQLTYGAMLGLVLVSPAMEALWEPKDGWLKKIWRLSASSMGAQIGILIPQLYWFGELPLLSLVLNLFVFGLTSGVMALYWLTLVFLPVPALAGVAGMLSAWITAVLMSAVRWLGSHDFIVLWTKQAGVVTAIGWLLLMLAASRLTVLRGRKRLLTGLAGTALIVLSLVPLPHTTTEYVQFSVGNADAAILHDRDTVVAVDTGEDGYELSRYLHHRRLRVDALVLTHLHMDHAGGVAALLEDGIPVGRCYIPEGAAIPEIEPDVLALLEALKAAGTEIVTVSRGDVIPLPSGSMTVLWPEEGKVRAGQDANLYSMALRADVHGVSMLLTGDLDGAYEMYAAAPADILKAAHHGAADSSGESFLKEVAPQTVILSTANRDRLARMQEKAGTAAVYSTEQHGAVTIRFEDGGYTISTYR